MSSGVLIGIIVIGSIIYLIGWIWLLKLAFEESVGWGLGVFFIPLVALIFIAREFGERWKPFATMIVGGFFIGAAFGQAAADGLKNQTVNQPIPLPQKVLMNNSKARESSASSLMSSQAPVKQHISQDVEPSAPPVEESAAPVQPTPPPAPTNPKDQNFVGKTVEEVETILGSAENKMELGDTIIYQFGTLELTSTDGGKTISEQKVRTKGSAE
jgi:hypothetical protein